MTSIPAITIDHVSAAQRRLAGHARVTPIHISRTLDAQVGAEVILKCENFQRAGAFKFRGAFNALSQLTPEQRRRGVVTHSSGNHAQAVALVGRLLGIATTVVMPKDAPEIKRHATAAYGAEVIEYDPDQRRRDDLSAEIEHRQGATLIPPFDHPDIIAGQGTATLELIDQAGALDMLLVPCGGGGLLSGSAIAAKARRPQCQVVGIEPALADDAVRSFRTGILQRVENPATLADGTRTESLGILTFPLIRSYVDDMQTVSEDAIKLAVRFLFSRMKLVVEPSGALGVAALLSGSVNASGRVGVILSGGNIDPTTMAEILCPNR